MTILITGASRGIGRALHAAYVHRGQTVIGTTRDSAPGNEGWAALDVTDPLSQQKLATTFGETPLDLLICNAGVYLDKGAKLGTGYPPQDWTDTFATNVTGVFLTVQSLMGNLERAESPKIAIIGSAMGASSRAHGGSYIYRASKAAAINLGRNLAQDLKLQGIAVGIYHPGWVRTDMGSAAADITVDQSVAGLVARFDALSLENTGLFEAYDGTPLDF